jgi:Family of unknown function (DUF5317)
MILVVAALACVASVPLTGGRLARLVDVPLRWAWTALGALALQIVITTLAPTGSTALHELLHVASYLFAAACIIANRRITGLPILALGAALNLLAITANHGIMPASERAIRLAGLAATEHFANSAPLAHPHLLALGDVIPVPGPWPLGNVISIGDILIIVGLFTVLHRTCRAPRRDPNAPRIQAVAEPSRRTRHRPDVQAQPQTLTTAARASEDRRGRPGSDHAEARSCASTTKPPACRRSLEAPLANG